uniref:Uncharacterized protein n=1 Tax=Tetradesmus obliquus TaxID=3088 RepID=A0A383WBI6_TETOB|eukprot:jgi/Sobl393_1/16682/SZX74384.1
MHMTRRSYSGTICYGGICGSGSGRPVAAIGSCRCSSGGHTGSGAGDHGAGSFGCCLPLEQRAVAGCKQAMFRGKQRRMRKQALWLCAVVLRALLCLPPVQAQPPTGSAAPAADEPPPGSDILEAFEILMEILQSCWSF